jgi:hypothetical protein
MGYRKGTIYVLTQLALLEMCQKQKCARTVGGGLQYRINIKSVNLCVEHMQESLYVRMYTNVYCGPMMLKTRIN